MNAYTALARPVRLAIGQDHRYEHTVRVARCAVRLARAHGVDARQALVAGMLHDLARLWSSRELIDGCERRGLAIDPFERSNPIVLHARLGAALAAEAYGIDDAEILSAIEKHTLGAAEMSPLDCVVYLADALEPGREYPERAALWSLALRNLRAATAAALESSARYLAKQGKTVAPQTAAAARAFGIDLDSSESHSPWRGARSAQRKKPRATNQRSPGPKAGGPGGLADGGREARSADSPF